MRWLFLIVLSLNIAFIAWQTTRPVAQLYENVHALKNVKRIVLLSELKQQRVEIAPVKKSEEIKRPVLTSDKTR